jgi:hypothetical protein
LLSKYSRTPGASRSSGISGTGYALKRKGERPEKEDKEKVME